MEPISALSKEYLRIWVDNATGAETPEVAFTGKDAKPVEADWKAAVWGRAGADGAELKILVGPGGGVELAPGAYMAWVRVTSPDERPVLESGLVNVI